MSYSRVLLVRWSRRDVLAVFALAAIVAFLTGGALFYSAAKDRPTDLAREYQPNGTVAEFESLDRARRASGAAGVVLPFTTLDSGRLVIGVGAGERERARQFGVHLPAPPDEGVATPRTQTGRSVRLERDGAARTLPVTQLGDGRALPDHWFVTRPATIETLGADGAFVVTGHTDPGSSGRPNRATGANSDTVVRSTLLFFQRGTDQVLAGFGLLIVAAGVLGAVTVSSVVRMTVRDRIETIQVVRATGATPLRVLALFATRGALLAAAAVVLGYAVGTIVSSVATSVAVSVGLSTTLDPSVTPAAASLLATTYLPLLGIGFVAGAVAALPAVRRPPAALTRPRSGDGRLGGLRAAVGSAVPEPLHLNLLDWRAVLPTTATVAVFAALVFLVLSSGAVAEPLAGTSSGTVVESGAIHPIASNLPQSHARAFQSAGIAASPEILVFGVVNDRPTIVRGARYEEFASVTDVDLREGRPPEHRGEALIGSDLARTQDLAVNDSVVVGGGVHSTVDRFDIVGRYDAPSAYDDQLLVSLSAARHLSSRTDGAVHFIRLERQPSTASTSAGITVLDVTVQRPVTPPTVVANVSLVNVAETTRSRRISLSLGGERVSKSVTLDPQSRRELRFRIPVSTPGTYRLDVGNHSQNLTVQAADALTLSGLPNTVPPGSAPLVRVRTVTGRPAANATVAVGNRTYAVSADGSVRLPFEATDSVVIRATAGRRSLERTVVVSPNATRSLRARLRIRPRSVSELTAPTATVRLSNPWNRTTGGRYAVVGPSDTSTRTVMLDPGNAVSWPVELSRQPRGEYAVALQKNGTRVASQQYRVVGDGSISMVALRNTDVAQGGGLGVALTTVFGNLQVIVTALVALASLMVSGTLVASFARTIHAHRRTLGIYRATGASPGRILRLMTHDGLLVGSVGVVAGIALSALALVALASRDVLVFFGIRVVPVFSPGRLAVVGVVALGLVLVGVLVPTVVSLRRPPATLFGDRAPTGPPDEASDQPTSPSSSHGADGNDTGRSGSDQP